MQAPIVSAEIGSAARGIVARYFRAWNDGDGTQVLDLIGADWVDHAHPERHSSDDVRDAIDTARALHPDTRVFVDAMLGDDSLITVNGRVETDGQVNNRVWIVRVEDERMREIWTYSGD